MKTLIAGSGATVAENDYIQANYLGQIWDTAKVFDNSFDRGPRSHPARARAASSTAGGMPSRQEDRQPRRVRRPADLGYGKEGNKEGGIKGTDTLVFVVGHAGTFNPKSSAKGTEVAQDNVDLPKVGTNTDGKAPSIEVPKTDAPKKLVATYVIEGDGDEVAAENTPCSCSTRACCGTPARSSTRRTPQGPDVVLAARRSSRAGSRV